MPERKPIFYDQERRRWRRTRRVLEIAGGLFTLVLIVFMVNVFRKQGAYNVTWLWTMNVLGNETVPLSAYWPGAAYVDWVGIDGYYMYRSDTYSSVFGSTITAIQSFAAGEPVIISETAIGPPGTEPSQIENMYAGIRSYGDLGLIWFD